MSSLQKLKSDHNNKLRITKKTFNDQITKTNTNKQIIATKLSEHRDKIKQLQRSLEVKTTNHTKLQKQLKVLHRKIRKLSTDKQTAINNLQIKYDKKIEAHRNKQQLRNDRVNRRHSREILINKVHKNEKVFCINDTDLLLDSWDEVIDTDRVVIIPPGKKKGYCYTRKELLAALNNSTKFKWIGGDQMWWDNNSRFHILPYSNLLIKGNAVQKLKTPNVYFYEIQLMGEVNVTSTTTKSKTKHPYHTFRRIKSQEDLKELLDR